MNRQQDLQDRLDRARSWIEAARVQPSGQKHAAFIFLYIAFNALYGRRRYEGSEEEARRDRQDFLRRLRRMHDYDLRHGQNVLQRALEACRNPGIALIQDIYLRDDYWKRKVRAGELREQFRRRATQATASLTAGRYEEFLELLLQRLTVLRNQVFHGCATYGPKSKGIESLENGLAVLRVLVPAFHELMSRYGQHLDWPPIPYPRVGSERHPAEDRFVEEEQDGSAVADW
ncbi:MAG: hypothetical protein D6690_12305 [Nitrospirae bacterium]|nr:MAG: hypothetical protein D6690_12305 [Nitrospirota bacterium]